MTQKIVSVHQQKKKEKESKIFDSEKLKVELLKNFKKLPKEHLVMMQSIQDDLGQYVPKGISLVDELIKDRKKESRHK